MTIKPLGVALGAVAIASASPAQTQSPPSALPPVVVTAPERPARTRRAVERPETSRPIVARRRVARLRRAKPVALPASAPPTALPTPTDAPSIVSTTAGPVQGIRALTASSATRTSIPVEQIPQSIQVVPRALIDQQAATTVSEAALNVSNVQGGNPLGIGNTDLAPLKIRGFPAEQWRDGIVSIYDSGDRDGLVNVERIEVLKGPGAILYGGGTGAPLGGVLNVISKLPQNATFAQTGIRAGSYGYWNPWLDINAPLTADGTALFRITGEFTGNRGFVDVLNSKRYNINPTLTLTNNESTTLTIQGFVSRQQQQAYQGLPAYGTLLGDFRVRRATYLGPRDIPDSYSRNAGATVTLDHQFDPIWSASVKARWSQSQIDQLAQNVFGGDATGAVPAFGPATWLLQNLETFQSQQAYTINPTLQAKFDAGPTRNVLQIGADYSRVTDQGFMAGDNLGNSCFLTTGLCPPATVDLRYPYFGTPYVRPNPGAGFEYAKYFDFKNSYVTRGAYTQIQSTIFERVHLLAGVRIADLDIDYLEKSLAPARLFQTKKTKWLPRAGIVVDLWSGLSAFASYTEGMRWAGFTTAVVRPAPEMSRQTEAGLKFSLGGTLSGTLAVFDIRRDNVPVTLGLGVAGLSEQKSQGFEADLIWQPTRNWSFLGSYGYTDATFASPFNDANGGTIPNGNKLPFVPAHSGRLWANYKFDSSVLPGWSIGAGVYAASSQYVDPANRWKTAGYFSVDAKLGYERDNWRASLSVKNLTGEKYFTPYAWLGGQVAPGAPRLIYAEIGYTFR